MKKTLTLHLLLFIFTVMFFNSCSSSDDSNPAKPELKVVGIKLYTNFTDNFGNKLTVEAKALGAILNGKKTYKIKQILSDSTVMDIKGKATFSLDDNSILDVVQLEKGLCEVIGKSVKQGKVTIKYNGYELSLDAWTNYNVEGVWLVYVRNDSTEDWEYNTDITYWQNPSTSQFGTKLAYLDYKFNTPTAKEFTGYQETRIGKIIDENTITEYSSSSKLYYLFKRK